MERAPQHIQDVYLHLNPMLGGLVTEAVKRSRNFSKRDRFTVMLSLAGYFFGCAVASQMAVRGMEDTERPPNDVIDDVSQKIAATFQANLIELFGHEKPTN